MGTSAIVAFARAADYHGRVLPAVLVATWEDGVFVLTAAARDHELAGRSVRGITADGRGGALAIVDGNTLCRRSVEGEWSTLVAVDDDLACCVAHRDVVYVGTNTARVLRLDADRTLTDLSALRSVKGRETWTAGQALVNGRLMGPPLGVRSISATPDGTLLANVHVGGIPRSTDGGASWHPTIAVDSDVHEVRAHPSRPEIVAAAAAAGLCTSRDGGATWHVQHEGLHARYCSAVAFVGDEIWVAASEHHFAPRGRLYRRPIAGAVALSPVLNDLPEWTDGIVDTHCIAVNGARVAFVDRGGNLYGSSDFALTWSSVSRNLPAPSSVLVV
jgi:hypothetical protein